MRTRIVARCPGLIVKWAESPAPTLLSRRRCLARVAPARIARVNSTCPAHGLRRARGHSTRTPAAPARVAETRAVVTAAPIPNPTTMSAFPVAT